MDMNMKKLVACAAAVLAAPALLAGNLCPDGVANAVPVKDGRPPVIDGRLDDWDLSGEEPCWNAEQYADTQYAKLAFMYDEANFYVSVRMGLRDHDYTNPNRPGDRYWNGDLVQVRLCTDPTIPHPLPSKNGSGAAFWQGRETLTSINLWKNTETGEDNLFIAGGPNWGLTLKNHPAGSAVKIVAEGRFCTMEARVPWSAVGVPSGRNPFKPGEAMSAVVDVKWMPGTDGHYTTVIFDRDPGAFAFLNLGTWGRIRFSPTGGLPPKPTTLEAIARAAREAANAPKTTSTPITVKIPKAGKLSVNIVREDGWVIRELIGGEPHDAGEVTVYWDGRDALGYPCETGRTYTWKAYLHDGLDWEYVGTVGVSGNPPYETADRKGGWGADHGPAVAAAADETGRYFAWHMSESGRGIVKTGFDGEVIWRKAPFVAGGWCDFSCLAVENGKIWLVIERGGDNRTCELVRLDAKTGDYELFPDGRGSIPIPAAKGGLNLPIRGVFALGCVGCAVKDGRVYVSDTVGNAVHVLDGGTGAILGKLEVKAPRGLCRYANALAVAHADGRVSKLGFDGALEPLFGGLDLPHGIAADADGALYVSEQGSTHQVRKFVQDAAGWRPVYALGAKGGRSPVGPIDKASFLYPAGLAVDKTGALLVPEMAPPKIVNLIDAATGRITRKYYGYTSYAPTVFPDCDDPRSIYYSLSGPDSFARARLPEGVVVGEPVSVWDYEALDSPFGSMVSTMNTPYVMRAANGRKYLVADGGPGRQKPRFNGRDLGSWPRVVCRVEANDVLAPVACVWNTGREGDGLLVWCDRNANGRLDESEFGNLRGAKGETYRWALQNGSMYLDASGDVYLVSQNDVVVRLRNRGWNAAGAPDWDVAAPEVAIDGILPGTHIHSGWRMGFLGMRRDRAGNTYASINCNCRYVDEAYTKYMHQGMGHTADMNAVFVVKYAPDGRLVWRTGRKAVGGAKPGEILHHWCHAGLVNDEYVVSASEWACFTFYTSDGFYVDRIFDTPGLAPADKAGPKGMGGEDFSGQCVYFPERDEVWAYNNGHVFRVLGFANGRVKGEWRGEGKVALTTVDPLVFAGKEKAIGDVRLAREGDRVVFAAHVKDASPLVNVSGDLGAVFKGGDAVGFEVGPAEAAAKLESIPERRPTGRYLGFVRILAARMGGKDKVVAFKPFTDGAKRPLAFETPAAGVSAFEYVGEVPGATVAFAVDPDGQGYRASISVPAAFFELDFAQPVAFEAEALLSGQGQRGVGTVERCYLNSPDSSATTMTDDVPTESRLYPKGWKILK